MGHTDKTYQWIDSPRGRIRYSKDGGGSRGRDFKPVELLVVDVNGRISLGIIRNNYLANGNDFNIEVVSFGWTSVDVITDDWTPRSHVCLTFTVWELEVIRALVCQAIQTWRRYDVVSTPSFLIEYPNSHFMGEVTFRDGWALIIDDEKREHS